MYRHYLLIYLLQWVERNGQVGIGEEEEEEGEVPQRQLDYFQTFLS